MPHIAITMFPGRNHELKTEIAKKVQTYLAGELRLDKKFVTVSIEDIPKESWDGFMKKIPESILYIKPES